MESKEFTAKSVGEAITKASIALGLASDEMDVEIVSEGSAGFLGLGAKPAVIRVSKKEAERPEEPSEKPAAEMKAESAPETAETEKAPEKTEEAPAEEKSAAAAPSENPEALSEADPAEAPQKPEAEKEEKTAAKPNKKEKPAGREGRAKAHHSHKKREYERFDRTEEELNEIYAAAEDFLKQVFAAMDLSVEVKSSYDKELDAVSFEFSGSNMGILIGKRGQTLDSLQYLTSLVVNKTAKHYIRVKLDTEDYRGRRKETLENLAHNLARKVKRQGEPVSLEPMNPYERRIIHSYLQNDRFVETYSEGNEPYRHIVIAPAKDRNEE